MRKRGTMSMLQAIIIFLLATFILFLFVQNFADFFKSAGDKQLCRLSVEAASKVKNIKKINLECYTQFLTFKNDAVYKKSINSKEYKLMSLKSIPNSEGDERKKDFLKKVLAEEVFDCWDQFGAGEKTYLGIWHTQHVRCAICSKVRFTQKYPSVTFGEFEEYLETKINSKETTFKEFLTKGTNKQLYSDEKKSAAMHTLPGKPMSVVFINNIGLSGVNQWVYAVNEEDLPETCEQLY
jgi:hypothetical protein